MIPEQNVLEPRSNLQQTATTMNRSVKENTVDTNEVRLLMEMKTTNPDDLMRALQVYRDVKKVRNHTSRRFFLTSITRQLLAAGLSGKKTGIDTSASAVVTGTISFSPGYIPGSTVDVLMTLTDVDAAVPSKT